MARLDAPLQQGSTATVDHHYDRHGLGQNLETRTKIPLAATVVPIQEHETLSLRALVMQARTNLREYAPAGKTAFLTNAAVDKPLQPFDDDDDRHLIKHGCLNESKQQWSMKHPPKKTARAVRVHILITLLMFALATAYRLPCEQGALGKEPVGWQRWRRQLLEQPRGQVIVFAQGCYGIFHMAEYSILLGVKLKDVPPGIGTYQEILAKFGLTAHG